MPTQIKVKYYKRWNASLNNNSGGWEIYAFKTPISAIIENDDYKLLTAGDKAYINSQKNGSVVASYVANDSVSYVKGELVTTLDGYVYICTADCTPASGETITASGNFAKVSVTEEGINSKISAAITALNLDSRFNAKVSSSDLLDSGNKIKMSFFPDAIAGQLIYGGTVMEEQVGTNSFNIVVTLTTNAKVKLDTTDTYKVLVNSDTSGTENYVKHQGLFYLCQNNFTFAGNDYKTGDWLLSTASKWDKVDNTDAVTQVNGRVGSIDIYRGSFSDGSEEQNRLSISNFTARKKGDIWYGSVTHTLYINAKDLDNMIVSTGVSYLYQLINYTAGIGTGAATTEEEGLGAIKPIGANIATDSIRGVVKLYNLVNQSYTDGSPTVSAVKTKFDEVETNISKRTVYIRDLVQGGEAEVQPDLPSTKYNGLIMLDDEA